MFLNIFLALQNLIPENSEKSFIDISKQTIVRTGTEQPLPETPYVIIFPEIQSLLFTFHGHTVSFRDY